MREGLQNCIRKQQRKLWKSIKQKLNPQSCIKKILIFSHPQEIKYYRGLRKNVTFDPDPPTMLKRSFFDRPAISGAIGGRSRRGPSRFEIRTNRPPKHTVN